VRRRRCHGCVGIKLQVKQQRNNSLSWFINYKWWSNSTYNSSILWASSVYANVTRHKLSAVGYAQKHRSYYIQGGTWKVKRHALCRDRAIERFWKLISLDYFSEGLCDGRQHTVGTDIITIQSIIITKNILILLKKLATNAAKSFQLLEGFAPGQCWHQNPAYSAMDSTPPQTYGIWNQNPELYYTCITGTAIIGGRGTRPPRNFAWGDAASPSIAILVVKKYFFHFDY